MLLETLLREQANLGIEFTVSSGGVDAAWSEPRPAHARADDSNHRAAGRVQQGAGSRDAPAETRRQDGELLAVLGHGAAGDAETLLVEQLGDPLVGERVLLVSPPR